MPLDWSKKEVELVVADYFNMLVMELQGKQKAAKNGSAHSFPASPKEFS